MNYCFSAVQSNERLEVCLRRLLCNSDLGPLLEIIRAEEYEQASAERYLHDFVHIVYKPTADQEDQVLFDVDAIAIRINSVGMLFYPRNQHVVERFKRVREALFKGLVL